MNIEEKVLRPEILRDRLVNDKPLTVDVYCATSKLLRLVDPDGDGTVKILWEAAVLDPETNCTLYVSGTKRTKEAAAKHVEGMMSLYRMLYKRTAERLNDGRGQTPSLGGPRIDGAQRAS